MPTCYYLTPVKIKSKEIPYKSIIIPIKTDACVFISDVHAVFFNK